MPTGIQRVKESPYSPDLTLCDRYLFTQLQAGCRSEQLQTADEVYNHVQRFLRPTPESALVHEAEKLLQHCKDVTRCGGEYIVDCG